MKRPDRRRFIKIAACGGAALSIPFSASAFIKQSKSLQPFNWNGIALGADASIQLYHYDKKKAFRLIRKCFVEIQRLEKVFSLYQSDSSLSILNREGKLDNAPVELVQLIKMSIDYGTLTDGAFDITVQPLWQLYSGHFSTKTSYPLAKEKIAEALSLVDYRKIYINNSMIALEKPNMAVTLNGIAQGYVTDKITELFKLEGLNNVMVEMGEMRVLGSHPTKEPWRVAIKDPQNQDALIDTVELNNNAIATSGGYGTMFDNDVKNNHLFNPHTGQSSNLYKSISVIAPTATQADALSTAFSMISQSKIKTLLAEQQNISVHIMKNDADIVRLSC